MAEKNCFHIIIIYNIYRALANSQWFINSSNHVCHCGKVVKELLECANKPSSTPGDTVFCFFAPFFFLFGLCFLTARTRINTCFILEKGFQKLLICILAKLTTRKKHKLSRHVPPLKQLNFFNVS